MVLSPGRILADPGFQPGWRNWWFASPARTRVGVTTASWGRWPTWVIRFRTRLWAISYGNNVASAVKGRQTTTWKEFIRRHMDVLAGTDFFTVEALTWRGFAIYYVRGRKRRWRSPAPGSQDQRECARSPHPRDWGLR